MDWLDSYDMRARIAPTILIISPLVFAVISLFQIQESIISMILGSVFFIIFIYFLSFWVRANGRKIEKIIWASSGGPPSTRIMMWDDCHLSRELKKNIYQKIKTAYDITLPSENQNNSAFLNIVETVFNRVKNEVRIKNPNGLWSIQNAEYGSVRNIYGSRHYFYVFSIFGVICCVFSWYVHNDMFSLLWLTVDFLIAICSSIFGYYLGPTLVSEYGFEYVESIWLSFLSLP